ncbi:hypothetical protein FHG64_16030 [Antarcticibacterium flavum]|uniref:Uncharacterized protein n=1 Tax=Antarcticibacterium flavum TaxID=2058175 RepID=A0A5B7X5V9_9FLAO|nr:MULTISPECIES: hypothetical protein [Antarcticibacterium]MCM4161872.1 hypothetical protein [Antarcticibacterium sp. W02-3]QCY70777.1 hypothetical protein FHG64_16030 [Antarcticibacterium flavum]
MAHVFKIVRKEYQIATDGSNYTLIDNLEFISDPFTSLEECRQASLIKSNALVTLSPAYVARFMVRYIGTETNNHYSFSNYNTLWFAVHYDGNSNYIENIKQRFREIQDRERP